MKQNWWETYFLPSPVIPTRLIRLMYRSLRERARITVRARSVCKIQICISYITNQKNKIGFISNQVINGSSRIVSKTKISHDCYPVRVTPRTRNRHCLEIIYITHGMYRGISTSIIVPCTWFQPYGIPIYTKKKIQPTCSFAFNFEPLFWKNEKKKKEEENLLGEHDGWSQKCNFASLQKDKADCRQENSLVLRALMDV